MYVQSIRQVDCLSCFGFGSLVDKPYRESLAEVPVETCISPPALPLACVVLVVLEWST